MKNRTDNTGRIERFLAGEMQGEELWLFEDELKTDSALASDFELTKDINQALSQDDEIEFLELIEGIDHDVSAKEIKRYKLKRFYFTAASVVILLASGYLYLILNKSYTPDELYAQYYSTYPAKAITRSAEAKPEDLFKEAEILYELEEYEEALAIFSAFPDTSIFKKSALFYSGVTYMEYRDFENAIHCLELVINKHDFIFYDHSNWYLGLCYLKTQQIEKAKKQFGKISKLDRYKRKEARAILEEL